MQLIFANRLNAAKPVLKFTALYFTVVEKSLRKQTFGIIPHRIQFEKGIRRKICCITLSAQYYIHTQLLQQLKFPLIISEASRFAKDICAAFVLL